MNLYRRPLACFFTILCSQTCIGGFISQCSSPKQKVWRHSHALTNGWMMIVFNRLCDTFLFGSRTAFTISQLFIPQIFQLNAVILIHILLVFLLKKRQNIEYYTRGEEYFDIYFVANFFRGSQRLQCTLNALSISIIKDRFDFISICGGFLMVYQVPTFGDMVEMYKKKRNPINILHYWYIAKACFSEVCFQF